MPGRRRNEHTGVRRTSMNLDTTLVAEARDVLGTNSTTDTVHRALSEVVLRQRRKRAASLRFDDLTPEALEQLRRPRA
jgi:Arc/MetJ family transcription regulator